VTKTIAVRIDEDLLGAVDSLREKSRSDVVREALELWLRRRILAEKVEREKAGYAKRPVKDEEFAPLLESQTWPK